MIHNSMRTTFLRKLYSAAPATLSGITLLVCGCTELNSKRLEEASTDNPANGQVYYLPKRTFEINATFVVVGCDNADDGAKFTYQVMPVVVSRLAGDVPYFVPHEDLNSTTKVTELKLELTEGGFLKSLNYSAEDKTGEIVASVAEGAAKIAATALGVPTLPSVPKFFTKNVTAKCSTEADKWLRAVRELEAKLGDAATADIDADSYKKQAAVVDAQKAYNDAIAAAKLAKESGVQAAIDKAADDLRAALKALNDAKIAADKAGSSRLTAIQRKIAAYQSAYLTFKASTNWTPNIDECASDRDKPCATEISVYAAQYKKLINGTAKDGAIKVEVKLFAQPATPSPPAASAKGLRYRQPVPGQLAICDDACKIEGSTISNAIAVFPFSIPQFGAIATLPLNNGVFDDNSVQASWSDDGMLTSLHFGSAASGLAAAQTFEKLAGVASDTEQKIYDQTRMRASNALSDRTAALQASKQQKALIKDINGAPDLDAIQNQIDRYIKLKELEDAIRDYSSSRAQP